MSTRPSTVDDHRLVPVEVETVLRAFPLRGKLYAVTPEAVLYPHVQYRIVVNHELLTARVLAEAEW